MLRYKCPMSSESLHEPPELLSERTKNMHRAVVSLIEELEAIDWYQQRAEACSDPELRDVLLHNKHEEIEHAMMTLEWLRRADPDFDENMRTYLFKEQPITAIEEAEEAGTAAATGAGSAATTTNGSLGIGSLKED